MEITQEEEMTYEERARLKVYVAGVINNDDEVGALWIWTRLLEILDAAPKGTLADAAVLVRHTFIWPIAFKLTNAMFGVSRWPDGHVQGVPASTVLARLLPYLNELRCTDKPPLAHCLREIPPGKPRLTRLEQLLAIYCTDTEAS